MQGTAVRIHTLKTAETMAMLPKHFNTNPTQQTQKGTRLTLQGEPHIVTHPKARWGHAPATEPGHKLLHAKLNIETHKLLFQSKNTHKSLHTKPHNPPNAFCFLLQISQTLTNKQHTSQQKNQKHKWPNAWELQIHQQTRPRPCITWLKGHNKNRETQNF